MTVGWWQRVKVVISENYKSDLKTVHNTRVYFNRKDSRKPEWMFLWLFFGGLLFVSLVNYQC